MASKIIARSIMEFVWSDQPWRGWSKQTSSVRREENFGGEKDGYIPICALYGGQDEVLSANSLAACRANVLTRTDFRER